MRPRMVADLVPFGHDAFHDVWILGGIFADEEERQSDVTDSGDSNDAREERIEEDNDAVDSLVNEAQEVSDEGIDK